MITGSLEAYFSVPGLKSPTEYSIVGQDPAPEEPVQIISIAEARTQGEGKVSVNGTVTAILKIQSISKMKQAPLQFTQHL